MINNEGRVCVTVTAENSCACVYYAAAVQSRITKLKFQTDTSFLSFEIMFSSKSGIV